MNMAGLWHCFTDIIKMKQIKLRDIPSMLILFMHNMHVAYTSDPCLLNFTVSHIKAHMVLSGTIDGPVWYIFKIYHTLSVIYCYISVPIG